MGVFAYCIFYSHLCISGICYQVYAFTVRHWFLSDLKEVIVTKFGGCFLGRIII